ncbi:MAG: Rpn family recombination-promoting nuclease/putative transposase [Enterococcus sp.]|nr:Rpn family recombination-promoting nuclease/putative transposase [Enterococcus sp.]
MKNKIQVGKEFFDFTDDEMFSYVMRDKEICKGLLQAILPHLKIKNIEFHDTEQALYDWQSSMLSKQPEIEKMLKAAIGKRGVRLDAYLEDEETIYNIEMQKLDYGDLLLRSRYYQAQIDSFQLAKGEDFENLKPLFVIFLCTFDPFKKGRVVYTAFDTCKEDSTIDVFDGATKIFINTNGGKGEISTELSDVLEYISKASDYHISKNSSELVKSIDFAVKKANMDGRWLNGMKTIYTEMRDRERYGMKRGIEKGRGQANREAALNFYKQGIEISIIASCLNQSEATIKQWLEE